MPPDTSPFDDIRALVASLPARRPVGPTVSVNPWGRIGEAASWAAGISGHGRPGAERALVCVFASSSGIAGRLGEGDAGRTALAAFTAGTAPANAVCAAHGLGFRAFDLAVELPGGDISREPAMGERDCVATIAFGMEAVAGGIDLLGLGLAEGGADVAAAAVLSGLDDDPPARWTADARGADLVTAALLRHGRDGGRDPLAVLASLGSRGLAAATGAILAARHGQVPVVLDGFAAAAAAAVLQRLRPDSIDHCLPGHLSGHPRHAALLERLGLRPLLTGLDLPGDRGLGAALALGLIRTAAAVR